MPQPRRPRRTSKPRSRSPDRERIAMSTPIFLNVTTGATVTPIDSDGAFAYFEAAPAFCGTFVHPRTGQVIDVTSDRITGWCQRFTEMRAAGLDVPVQLDHDGPEVGRVIAA